MKLGIIVFANDSGLGAQTRRLCEMLKPSSILAIDSSGFSRNKAQHFDWYDSFTGYRVDGFPKNNEINTFLNNLTHVLVCENPLNFYLFSEAKRRGIKTYCQSNYEFNDNLNNPNLPVPDMFLMPSYWKIKEMKERFGNDRVIYMPPPIDPNEFKESREINFERKGKKSFLHIVGTLATHDRNGTLDILKALEYSHEDYSLTIKSQHDLPQEYITNDRRVSYKIGNDRIEDLYKDYDAVIFPRRYGGLSLGTNEALMSGLPVIMTDISPNDELLPKGWLVGATKIDEFKARVPIDVYGVYPTHLVGLVKIIDYFAEHNLDDQKTEAFSIAHNEFSPSKLLPLYNKLW